MACKIPLPACNLMNSHSNSLLSDTSLYSKYGALSTPLPINMYTLPRSALTIQGVEQGLLDEDGRFHKSFAALKQLSSLSLSAPWSRVRSFSGPSLLQHLEMDVVVDSDVSLSASASTALKKLTSLSLTTKRKRTLWVSYSCPVPQTEMCSPKQ